jgi:hypothetical protein
MNTTEAAELIEVIIGAITSNPSQFHLSINVTGQQVTSHGGTGLHVSVTGGGIGSTTIGNQVSMSDASVQISQQQGIQAVNEQMNALLNTLREIASQLRSQSPNKSLVQQLVNSLKSSWVPGVIVGVVGNAVSKALGI